MLRYFSYFVSFVALAIGFSLPLIAGCIDSGHENGVPKCEEDGDRAITNYFMGLPQFEKWNRSGQKFPPRVGDGSVAYYTPDDGCSEAWASKWDTTGCLTYGPYLRFDYPGSILVKFYLRVTAYVGSPGKDREREAWRDLFTLDLTCDQRSLVKRGYRLSDFKCEDLGRGYANCFFAENLPIGIGVENLKFPMGTTCAHLSTVTESAITGFEARVHRETSRVSLVLSKIVITYTRQ